MPPARWKAAGNGELFLSQCNVVNVGGDPVIGNVLGGNREDAGRCTEFGHQKLDVHTKCGGEKEGAKLR
jgi:hypothetical protein